MIDVVFQLLIFFLCTVQFRTLEGHLEALLPRGGTAAAGAEPEEPLELEVRVTSSGERRDPSAHAVPWSGVGPWEYVGRRVQYRMGPRRTEDLATLERWLAELWGTNPARPLRVRAGPGTLHGEVLWVLDRARSAGLETVSIAARE